MMFFFSLRFFFPSIKIKGKISGFEVVAREAERDCETIFIARPAAFTRVIHGSFAFLLRGARFSFSGVTVSQ